MPELHPSPQNTFPVDRQWQALFELVDLVADRQRNPTRTDVLAEKRRYVTDLQSEPRLCPPASMSVFLFVGAMAGAAGTGSGAGAGTGVQ